MKPWASGFDNVISLIRNSKLESSLDEALGEEEDEGGEPRNWISKGKKAAAKFSIFVRFNLKRNCHAFLAPEF
ncbi:hypothetical protein ACFX2G_018922 [Malus domestica]